MLQALGQLRAARRRPRGRRAAAPDRRRAHAARLPRHRPRPAAAGAGRASSARRSTSSPAACSSADSFRVSPALQRKLGTDFSERGEALIGGDGSAQTDYSPSEQRARPAALAARRADERHRRDAPAREQREGADRRRPRAAHARALRPPDAGGVERARRPAATSRRCAARCSATTSTASPRCCCGPARRAAPTRAARCARRRARCSSASAPPATAPGLSEETRAHLADSADTLEQALSARLQRAGA